MRACRECGRDFEPQRVHWHTCQSYWWSDDVKPAPPAPDSEPTSVLGQEPLFDPNAPGSEPRHTPEGEPRSVLQWLDSEKSAA